MPCYQTGAGGSKKGSTGPPLTCEDTSAARAWSRGRRASTGTDTDRAVADLIGAFCYALLRVFHLNADAAVSAPTSELAERQTDRKSVV